MERGRVVGHGWRMRLCCALLASLSLACACPVLSDPPSVDAVSVTPPVISPERGETAAPVMSQVTAATSAVHPAIDSLPAVDLAALAGPLRFGDGSRPADDAKSEGDAELEDDEPSMMDHPRLFGWSRDGARFGWCQPVPGDNCELCVLVEVASDTRTEMERGKDCGRPQAKQIAAAWKEHGIGEQPQPATWPFGRDLGLSTWRVPARGGRSARLHIGGRFAGEAPVGVVTVVEPEFVESDPDYTIFAEAILLSPDGSRLAILVHAFAGEFSDKVRLTVVDSAGFAFGVYHESGLALLKKDPALAAERFAVAAAIDPEAWKAWHNLACAHALAGQPDRAEAPLVRALATGGDAARAKARVDPDLAAARERPWFAALVQ